MEAALLSHPEVREAVAVVREDVPGDKRLVAYVVPPPGQPLPDMDSLRAFLAQRLPEFMRPSAFVALESLPLTSNAKVDRKALPAPDSSRNQPYTPPRTPTEERLAALWAQVLHVPQVGRDDDFFSLGGHSLLATQVMARLRGTFGVELPLRTLFEAPTVRDFAARLEAAVQASGSSRLPAPGAGAPERPAAPLLRPAAAVVPGSARAREPSLQPPGGASGSTGRLDLAALRHASRSWCAATSPCAPPSAPRQGQPLQVIAPPSPPPGGDGPLGPSPPSSGRRSCCASPTRRPSAPSTCPRVRCCAPTCCACPTASTCCCSTCTTSSPMAGPRACWCAS